MKQFESPILVDFQNIEDSVLENILSGKAVRYEMYLLFLIYLIYTIIILSVINVCSNKKYKYYHLTTNF